MALDPTKHADWEIAEEAESRMKTVYQLGEELGWKRKNCFLMVTMLPR
jgi:tRNA(Arg) A34 adenosine deaminase TadA